MCVRFTLRHKYFFWRVSVNFINCGVLRLTLLFMERRGRISYSAAASLPSCSFSTRWSMGGYLEKPDEPTMRCCRRHISPVLCQTLCAPAMNTNGATMKDDLPVVRHKSFFLVIKFCISLWMKTVIQVRSFSFRIKCCQLL